MSQLISYTTIATPALLLDERKMKKNIQTMMEMKQHHVTIRPHFKTHKTVYIAKEQIAAGASGITVATSSEGELLLENGIKDILIAFPLSDPIRMRKLLQWNEKARIIFTVDSIEQAKILA